MTEHELESLEELAALDAAAALDDDSRRRYAARLAEATDEVRRRLAPFYDAASVLATSPPVDPAPETRRRLMERLAATGGHCTVRASDGDWVEVQPGMQLKVLCVDQERHCVLALARMEAGTVYPAHHHAGSESCYVIAGEVLIQGQRLRGGDFTHSTASSEHDEVICLSPAEMLLILAAEDFVKS